MAKILVIDDEPLILDAFRFAFPLHTVVTCTSAAEGVELFQTHDFQTVISDIRLPDKTGLQLIAELRAIDTRVPIVLMTGRGTAGTAIDAMRQGAFEYILKPLDPDLLCPIVESAIETCKLMKTPALLPGESADPSGDILIGDCPAMQEVYRAIGRVASRDVTVLILGESGTGKEVVARAIYNYSSRSMQPFLAINCAAIPENLLESELFGHEKGSFTGAERTRVGKFEQCSGGTLFLDEIGDMPLVMQAKILRVLQDQAFERVGGNETVKTSVRLIAATNRDLSSMIEERMFRSDLFYRLNVYSIRLPPLRERGDDIRALTEHFAKTYATELGKELTGVAPETIELLRRYDWPGNVRELQGIIKHALLESTGPVLVPAYLPAKFREGITNSSISRTAMKDDSVGHEGAEGKVFIDQLIEKASSEGNHRLYETVIDEVERLLIKKILDQVGGNQSEAAKLLGITRTTLRAKIAKTGIGIHRVVD